MTQSSKIPETLSIEIITAKNALTHYSKCTRPLLSNFNEHKACLHSSFAGRAAFN